MVNRLFVVSTVPDARAKVRGRQIGEEVFLVDVYTIEKLLNDRQLKAIGVMLTHPVAQQVYVNTFTPPKIFSQSFEIGFLPGVTDNVAATTREMIEDLLGVTFGVNEGVYTSQITYISGKGTKKDIMRIAGNFMNPLIQHVVVGRENFVPRVILSNIPKADLVDLNVSDEELIIIGKQGIANPDGTRRGPLALDLSSMKAIQAHFHKQKRSPTDVELESLAQTWSEHCKHTIMNSPIDDIDEGLFRQYIKRATDEILKTRKNFCVSVFTDNSGAITFDNKFLITHKVETHNSPSALDPFGGAITGIVGVNRDCIGFGLGAKPVANTYGFCLANTSDNRPLFRDKELKQKMLSPRRILDGVVAGVNSGGNCSGIPTPQGFVYFDERYKGKPLVFVGTIGLIPKKVNGRATYEKKARSGDYIVMVGGRVGLDGIHGATFSSEALDSGSPATSVQIGDPITQKKMSDALIKEARDLGLYTSITDNGAGGLSCSVAEMAKESGGCSVHLEKVPLKYPGLAPWQIWISESQERMTLAVPKGKWKKFFHLMRRRGVEASIIGTFTNSGRCRVYYHTSNVMDLSMEFLHHGFPRKHLLTSFHEEKRKEPKVPEKFDYTKIFLRMLARGNIASYEFISVQFDHEVQGTSVLKPLQGKGRVNGDATVIKPLFSSPRGIGLSQGLYPNYTQTDTYAMAACAIDTAIRNLVAVGVDPDNIALLDNFCWCSSHEQERLGQLKQAAQACYDYATAYQTPFISGKDSMFNDFKGYDEKGNPIKISIPPTLLISSIGVIDDVTNVVSLDAKFPGDLVYVLGETHEEVGGSEYLAMLGFIGNEVPQVDAGKNKKLYVAFHACAHRGLVVSAQSVGRGGLAVALNKTALGGMLGLDVTLNNLPGRVRRDDVALFSESQGRILVTIAPQNQQRFEKILKGNSYDCIGEITGDNTIRVRGRQGKIVVSLDLDRAVKAYKLAFKDY